MMDYFFAHLNRLDYRGRLGSDSLEGEYKTLGLRLRAQGLDGGIRNAEAVAALICCRHAAQWDLFWSRTS